MGKIQEAQQKVEETKQRLETIYLTEEGANGKITVTISGNRQVKDIHIDESLMEDAEELADHLVITINKAITKASEMNENEMQSAAAGMLNMPGMDQLFNR